jgi:hypothetical protein
MKYNIKVVKEVRHFLEFEIEANSPQEAKNQVWDLGEKNGGTEVDSDCTYFDILECKQIN